MLVRQRKARPESDSVCQLKPCIMRANGWGGIDIPVQSTHIRMNRELLGYSSLYSVLCTVCGWRVCRAYVNLILGSSPPYCTDVIYQCFSVSMVANSASVCLSQAVSPVQAGDEQSGQQQLGKWPAC